MSKRKIEVKHKGTRVIARMEGGPDILCDCYGETVKEALSVLMEEAIEEVLDPRILDADLALLAEQTSELARPSLSKPVGLGDLVEDYIRTRERISECETPVTALKTLERAEQLKQALNFLLNMR